MNPRRLARLHLTDGDLSRLLLPHLRGFPADVRVAGAASDLTTRTIIVYLESDSFDDVEAGSMLPEVGNPRHVAEDGTLTILASPEDAPS